ncbi:hypothetical protein DICSQDRAFT_128592 [Dichomitus squalens LYAD-421 SS1]|uniref:Uncharacterized protein n=1 Tax=Dichomitus squalens (strain LYAD-421) TaxID=732165 RepID=R7SV63_DICSQ|nr:uncharacterized protein DICSQDRAFT_128592 [Dichomitus squalens LYAD-421 SS1]EJF58862.1 hypothetical protein DICSQDRAFT_128592 [Dichomitus squalens LYAD-421 SS1]
MAMLVTFCQSSHGSWSPCAVKKTMITTMDRPDLRRGKDWMTLHPRGVGITMRTGVLRRDGPLTGCHEVSYWVPFQWDHPEAEGHGPRWDTVGAAHIYKCSFDVIGLDEDTYEVKDYAQILSLNAIGDPTTIAFQDHGVNYDRGGDPAKGSSSKQGEDWGTDVSKLSSRELSRLHVLAGVLRESGAG